MQVTVTVEVGADETLGHAVLRTLRPKVLDMVEHIVDEDLEPMQTVAAFMARLAKARPDGGPTGVAFDFTSDPPLVVEHKDPRYRR